MARNMLMDPADPRRLKRLDNDYLIDRAGPEDPHGRYLADP